YCFVLQFQSSASPQQEKIYSYHSDIVINKDASMTVTETIKVKALGIDIKRGIYRDFPTTYEDSYGNKIVVNMDILGVYRDDRPDDYHTESLQNGKRIYIGNENVFLDPGDYTYKLVYKTSRQLGFFRDHDELYWNVTGNGWVFPIESASATINLPESIPSGELKYYGYTGRQGSRESNLTAYVQSPGRINYKTDYPLGSYEGLTIVVEFPKGIVQPPTAMQNISYFAEDNLSEIIGVIGLIVILFYYIIVWIKVGKDPEKDVIIPLFNPPDNISPAAARYIKRMGFDSKSFTASIINMAVKGYLKIIEKDGKYSLLRLKTDTAALSKEEKKIAEKLQFSKSGSDDLQAEEALNQINKYKNSNNFFARTISGLVSSAIQNKLKTSAKTQSDTPGEYELELKNTNHSIFSSAINALKKELKNSYEKTYFITNRKQFVIGAVISFVFLAASISMGHGEQVFLLVWISIWSLGVGALLINLLRTWKQLFAGGKIRTSLIGAAIFSSLFALPFVIGEIVGVYLFYSSGSVVSGIIAGIIFFLNILFYQLLKAPTLLGRKLLDKIEGFEMYLSTAEKDRLNYITPVERTPELFEKYLPYAFALSVEQKWSEQFSDVLSKAAAEQNYSPSFYSGAGWSSFNAAGFASSFSSSFSGAISSSSTAPGSSSGSGGSSGGGGGGGGGGGW
ncbi:MAG TPA: DUF2207 domain-containing protein, partial [Ignavibacteriaceae bacterium]